MLLSLVSSQQKSLNTTNAAAHNGNGLLHSNSSNNLRKPILLLPERSDAGASSSAAVDAAAAKAKNAKDKTIRKVGSEAVLAVVDDVQQVQKKEMEDLTSMVLPRMHHGKRTLLLFLFFILHWDILVKQ